MGISRSTTVVIAYLIATTEMTPFEALASVQSKRTFVRPNRGFMSQLLEYHSKSSNSLQAKLGDDEPPDKEVKSGKGKVKARRDRATLTAKGVAKSYARYALTAVTSLPPHISQYSPEGREYWKLEDRLF
jgi:hypothetical protein